MPGLNVILVGVHADGEQITLGSSFEHTLTRATGNLVDDIRPLIILTERGFQSEGWVGKIEAEITDQYLAVRADFQDTLLVAVKELVQTWCIATDNGTHSLGF